MTTNDASFYEHGGHRRVVEPDFTSTAGSFVNESPVLRRGGRITIREMAVPGSDAVERQCEIIGWDHGVLEVRAVGG